MTKPRKKFSKRRLAFRTVAIVVLIVGVWMAVIVGNSIFEKGADYRPHMTRVLEQMSRGEAGAVYDEASPALKKELLRERFVELGSDIGKTLGAFESVERVVKSDQKTVDGSTTGFVRAVVRFQRASTRSEVSFVRRNGAWILLGLEVEIPHELRDSVVALRTSPARLRAPEEVLAATREIVALLARGEVEAVYQGASPYLKEGISLDDFVRAQSDQRQILGAASELVEVQSSAQNSGKNKATVTALLSFGRDRVPLKFDFVRTQSESWKLYAMRVLIQ